MLVLGALAPGLVLNFTWPGIGPSYKQEAVHTASEKQLSFNEQARLLARSE